MDLRTRTKIRWIKFYSADLPHKNLSNKDLLIINGLLDPSKIQHATLFKNPTVFFVPLCSKIRRKSCSAKSVGKSIMLFGYKIRRFFCFPLVQKSVEKLVLQTPSFFVSNIRWKWSTKWIKRFDFFPWTCCHFTLILVVQELSLAAWHYRLYQRSWIDLSKFAQTHTIDGTLDFLMYKPLASAQAFLAMELLVDGITIRQELGEFSHWLPISPRTFQPIAALGKATKAAPWNILTKLQNTS